MSERAEKDIDGIYEYIAKTLSEPGTALVLVDDIEKGILSLDLMPHRYSMRRVGMYANRGYRQLFIKNYTVIFRIVEKKKSVIILTVRYSQSRF